MTFHIRYLLAQLILRPRVALAFVAQRALGGKQQSLAVLRQRHRERPPGH